MKRILRTGLLAAVSVSALVLTGCGGGAAGDSAAASPSAYASLSGSKPCQDLRKDHPELAGKTLKNAINPHTPGYEAINPQNPNEYVGFDIDLGEALGSCLGFGVSYVPVAFAELIPTLSSGQADIVISDLYATEERAANVDFVTYSKVFDGILVAKDNPKKIGGINSSMCGATVALNKGFVEVPLVEALAPDCKAAGKPEPTVSLFDSNADCAQAIMAGRADAYINDVNTVNTFVSEQSGQLSKATAVTLPYKIGIGVPQSKTGFRDAILAALKQVQATGLQTELAKKWHLDENSLDAPTVLSTK
jgi:polar amino acid transport system substrate-binding protein